MSAEHSVPVIGFVWRPEEVTPSVIRVAERTGSKPIFDFSMMPLEALCSFLGEADPDRLVTDIKISVAAFLNPSLAESLKERGVRNIWIECHPGFSQPDSCLQRLKELSPQLGCFPIIGNADLLGHIANDPSRIDHIVLKGCEASGFVSSETTAFLYAMVKEMHRSSRKTPNVLIWGSVATPEAAAAFLSTGAAGIVFESIHWLTDLVAIDHDQRRRIMTLRLDSSDLVGLDLHVPCRLFNKGNSLGFKKIRSLEDSLRALEINEESRRSFADQVNEVALHPLESHFSQDEVIPLSLEATFARSFVERFGTGTEEALKAFMDETHTLCSQAGAYKDYFLDSPAAKEMGTGYPFIQGAMSWITDVPEFAAQVADAGGLPTIALGLMDGSTIERRLGRLKEIMGDRPFAVNVVSLAENPFRETHLAWIKKQRPPFVVIAGGDLSSVRTLIECGIEVMYIASDEGLLRMALEAGVRYVICEGYEAGGHVGQHSTFTLAQMILDIKKREPSLFHNCRVVLAGGIFNRETAFLAAMLGADILQMGTAYLATGEIVESGALTALYQRMILESNPEGTVLSGRDTGLRVRSLRTPRVEAILSLEREFATGNRDEAAFRKEVEKMAAGSLFVAARGMDRPDGETLDERSSLERGQFMSGACAGIIGEVKDLASLHRELAEGPIVLHLPRFPTAVTESSERPSSAGGNGRSPVPVQRDNYERIAVTGMSILNTLGASPEEVWANSMAMKSGIGQVPSSRWDHSLFYDPRPQIPDKTYCEVGAFLDFPISRKELGIPPHDFRTMTEATRITLWLADKAIRASGILESDIPRERIAVLIAQNSGEAAGTLTDMIIRSHIHDIIGNIKRAVPLTADQESLIEGELKAGRMVPDDTTLLGRLNCAAPGFICNRYGFMGPSYAVSAACATALVAIHSAIQMIRNGIVDAAIVGGGEDNLTHLHYVEFSALGALYGLSGQTRPPQETSRPFDAERDGLVLGEGGGMIIIERESVARARGAAVHAFITGMGASNSNLGMVESASASQEIAIGASFRSIPYGPDTVDLVECHATSTRQGDVEEVQALKKIYPSSKRTMLTAFKSQIGHTLGVSGMNSLIRGIMAMKAGIFPATLNYRHPDPDMGLEGSGFTIPSEPLEWKNTNGKPRRLQVNAFGFGGSNYVLQVEQSLDEAAAIMVSPGREPGSHLKKESHSSTVQGVSFFRTEIDNQGYRMAVVSQSHEEALRIIKKSDLVAHRGIVSPGALRSLERQGMFISREDSPILPLALVFPGQGSQYAGMGRDLYESFPVIREWMDQVAQAADFDILHLLFHDGEEKLKNTRWQQPALFVMEHAMARQIISLGAQPVAMAGHSLGELIALCLAGVYSPEDGFRIVNKRAICMDKAAAMNMDPGVMAAVDVPLDLLKEMIRERQGVHIGNINSPHQTVLSGGTDAVKNFCKELKELGHRATLLPVSMAFHSPIMSVIRDELQAYIADIPFHPPRIPVISNTTGAPYPPDTSEIKRILMAHLENPVHWMSNVQTLWKDYGIRLFTEVGPGETLSNLITDTFSESTCIHTCLSSSESRSFRSALARLFVERHLEVEGEPQFVSLPAFSDTPENYQPSPASALPSSESSFAGPNAVERIIQREINRFTIETFGRFLKPAILEALRQNIDPAFQESDLSSALRVMIGEGLPSEQRKQDSPGASAPATSDSPPLSGEASQEQDLMERLIRIVMDSTGFNRDEIEPAMDLRKDLSIRSSRLPIIMDAVERQFGITIELEDFFNVRTVEDMARSISMIIARQEGAGLEPGTGTMAGAAEFKQAKDEDLKPSGDGPTLKRILFKEITPESASASPVKLSPDDTVLLLSPGGDERIANTSADILREEYGVLSAPILCMGHENIDIRTDEGVSEAARRMAALPSLSGMVITLGPGGSEALSAMADVSPLLRGLFSLVKTFLQSPARKFLVLIHSREIGETDRLLVEGLLGLFLSAAQEYPSVTFHTLEIDRNSNLRAALQSTLDGECAPVEIVHRDGQIYTSQGRSMPSVFEGTSSLKLSPGDIIVMSGGATGISAHLARCLAPFSPRLVFLGRTSLHRGAGPSGACAPGSHEASHDESRAQKIKSNLVDLQASGIEATYYSCNVADPEAVRATMDEVVRLYGRVDGIIHGAGVLRNALLSEMTADDFSTVTDVKFLGAWNLFTSAKNAGLRFFVGLSSGAAILGNPGQANYAAANRLMSALLRTLRRDNRDIRFKALMLPPVEGEGMADDPDVQELLTLRGVSYIDRNELAGLFCRELFVAPAEDDWVMFMKKLPPVKTALLDDAPGLLSKGNLNGGILSLSPGDFPMIEEIISLDMAGEQMEASRLFSREKDLWISDHRPFKSMEHPLVSAAMILEMFMESARILYPHLQVRGVRQVRFMDMIQCYPGDSRSSRISCRRSGNGFREILCEASLEAQEMTLAGRLTDRFYSHSMGQVILSGGNGDGGYSGERVSDDFPVRPEELKTKPVNSKKVLQWYKDRSGLEGRYRVIEGIDGTGPGVIRGRTTYRETDDFAHLRNARYQYSPYLFEALVQLAAFHIATTDPSERRQIMPAEVGEMRFLRKCRAGESITLEARMRAKDDDGFLWDARGTDDQGRTVMGIHGLRMHMVSD